MQIPSIFPNLPLFFQSHAHGNAKSFKSDLTPMELDYVHFLVGNHGHYDLRKFGDFFLILALGMEPRT